MFERHMLPPSSGSKGVRVRMPRSLYKQIIREIVSHPLDGAETESGTGQ
jgi:hypothetical protein